VLISSELFLFGEQMSDDRQYRVDFARHFPNSHPANVGSCDHCPHHAFLIAVLPFPQREINVEIVARLPVFRQVGILRDS